ncbi:MAG TPA: hypothetical protein VKV41_25480 [Methylomirabilota bacterium]|nr:hypothetical protein [Methylomirabilota bacterium]
MPQQGTAYLVPFGTAGMVSHPNRWRAKAGEILIGENVVVENDLINKEPAATYYDPQGIDSLPLQVAWTPTTAGAPSIIAMVFVDALPTSQYFGTRLLTGIAGTVTSPWVSAPFASIVAVGCLHAVRISALTGGATSITDSRGNTYTLLTEVTQASGLHGQIWGAVITQQIQSGDTVTITFSPGTANVNIISTSTSDVKVPLTVRENESASSTGSTTSSISGMSQSYPLIGIALAASSSSTVTPDYTSTFRWTNRATVNSGAHRLAALTSNVWWASAHIAAQIEWVPDDTSAISGSTTVVAGSNIITTQVNTVNAFRPGDIIIVGGESQVVKDFPSSTQISTVTPFATNQTVASVTRRAGPVLITVANIEQFSPAGGYILKEDPTRGALGAHGNLDAIWANYPLAMVRPGRFVVGGKEDASRLRKLFYLNGVDPVQVLPGDGQTAAPIAKPAADWGTTQDASKQPLNGIVHQDSLVIFGNLNDPHRIYWSTPADHEDFQTTAAPAVPYMSIRVASNIGRRLYGAAQYQGVLYLWKYPYGIFYVDDTPTDRLQWSYRTRSTALGCAPSPYAVLAVDDDVIFCDAEGHFHLLSAVASLGGTRDSDITRALGLHTWTQQNVNIGTLNTLVSVYDTATKTAWFGLRSASASAQTPADNDLVIRWDFSLVPQGGPMRMTTARMWVPNAFCLKHRDFTGRQAVVIGEYGNAWFVEPQTYGRRTDRDFVANADTPRGVATRISLPELDYGDAQPPNRAVRKSFRALEMIAQATENTNHPVAMTINVDGVYRQTLRYPQGPNRRRLQPLQCGDGYSLSGDITTDGSVVGDVPLIGLVVYYAPTGTDQSRKS